MDRTIEQLGNGVVVCQATDEPELKNNIYCERSYCSPDSRCFVYQRQVSTTGPVPWQFGAQYVACEFGTWEKRVLGRGFSYPEITPQGGLYYARAGAGDERELVRVDVATGEAHAVAVDGGVRPYTGMTLPPDERLLAYGVPMSFAPQMFGVEVVDLEAGTRRIVCEDPEICNPHTQFETCDGAHILVQHNRGCKFNEDGRMISPLGEEGCTLFLVAVADGRITPLQVGPPHTPSCTGHQQWIGYTGEVLLTVSLGVADAVARGNLLGVRAGGAARVVSKGQRFMHVHASVCGRYFCCDAWRKNGECAIVVGSIATGRNAVVCTDGPGPADAYARYGQSSHAHPYLSPDLKWVVFNSCRTGRPEINVASVPPGMIASL